VPSPPEQVLWGFTDATRLLAMGRGRVGGAWALALLFVLACQSADAQATVVEHGYLPLGDGTRLSYTLTRPSAAGRFSAVLKSAEPVPAGSLTIRRRVGVREGRQGNR
jgi:hypothetical protein